MQRMGDYTRNVGGIQITQVNLEPQRNYCDEETVRSEDTYTPTIICYQFQKK